MNRTSEHPSFPVSMIHSSPLYPCTYTLICTCIYATPLLNAPIYFHYLSISFVIIPSLISPDMFSRLVSFRLCFAHTLVRAITHRPPVIPLIFRHDTYRWKAIGQRYRSFRHWTINIFSSVIIDKTTRSLLT
jgi:hypothetical protein